MSEAGTATTLAGKVVVVMGAGSSAPGWSNGKASAITYAREGAAVVCADYHVERAQEAADAIRAEGHRAVAVQADATHEADVEGVMKAAVEEFGGIDVLHNNVGVGGTVGAPDDLPPDLWQREVDQNLTSAYLGIRCVVPHLRQRGGGVILNTSSLIAVRFLRRPSIAYTASKAAVEAMTRACAMTYGPDNIRVNCIRIGFAETPLILNALSRLSDEERETALAKSRAKVPLRREHTDAFDVARAAAFLASDAARHITGVILNVDGGLECAPI